MMEEINLFNLASRLWFCSALILSFISGGEVFWSCTTNNLYASPPSVGVISGGGGSVACGRAVIGS